MVPFETDVLIVGAGPTGLALACALQQAGIDHVLVDERAEGTGTSRAAVIHAHTLEALEAIGVVETLSEQGLALRQFIARDRDAALLSIGFADLPSRHRHILMVPQSTTERVLTERLIALGGRIYRGVAAAAVERHGDGAAARLSVDGKMQAIRARYVVGADGMHSIVRQAAGIGFRGEAYAESFILADVRMAWPLGRDEVSLFFSADGLVVVAPLPDGSFRVVATLDQAPEVPTIQDVQQLLNRRGPAKSSCEVRELVWGSRFRVHHRLANEYRSGPFLLMGDAAHVHSPAGGQGMNAGLVDAMVLGEALKGVLCDGLPTTILNAYAETRRPAAEQVLALAGRLTRLALVRPAPLRFLRNLLLRSLNRARPFRRNIALNLSGITRRKFSQLPAQAAAQMAPRAEMGARLRLAESHGLID
jgi:2-polyprenyl-6-methoxyphenol hydroxylase-like FAD-dependent oxidoreductase